MSGIIGKLAGKSAQEQQGIIDKEAFELATNLKIKEIISLLNLILSTSQYAFLSSNVGTQLANAIEKAPFDNVFKHSSDLEQIITIKGLKLNEDSDLKIRKIIANIYSSQGYYREAANVLKDFHFEEAKGKINADEWVNAVMLIVGYLIRGDFMADASVYIYKAEDRINEVKNEETKIGFKRCSAIVYDSLNKFIQSAMINWELSQHLGAETSQEDINIILEDAIKSIVVAPSGGPKTRMINFLISDPRTTSLNGSKILKKMFYEKYIKRSKYTEFEKTLKDHQKAKGVDGFSTFEKAILEHNIIALSKIYNNISLENLTSLLEIPLEKAEQQITTLISKYNFKAVLDQREKFVYFEADKESIEEFSEQIRSISEDVDELVQYSLKAKPQLKKLIN